MRNWDTRDESGTDKGCEWEKDWDDVQRVCKSLGIPCTMVCYYCVRDIFKLMITDRLIFRGNTGTEYFNQLWMFGKVGLRRILMFGATGKVWAF